MRVPILASALAWATLLLVVFLDLPAIRRSFVAPHGWAWSDLHVNYAGGFVRRGLLGEAAHRLQTLSGISTRGLFGATFATATLLEVVLLARLLWPLRARPLLFVSTLASPALLLFAAYDFGAYLRRDVFLSLGVLAHALLLRALRQGRLDEAAYLRALALGLAPYLAVVTLVTELQWFLLPVHGVLSWSALSVPLRRPAAVALPYLPAFVLGVLSFVRHGDAGTAAAICASWAGRAAVGCGDWSAIGALAWSPSRAAGLSLKILDSPRAVGLWLLAAALAALPVVALLAHSRREGKPLRSPARALIVLLLSAAPLFLLGWDWGRWLHLLAMAGVAVCLAESSFAAPPARRRSPGIQGLLAIAALAYLLSWRLPHTGLPRSLAGGFVERFPEALRVGATLAGSARPSLD